MLGSACIEPESGRLVVGFISGAKMVGTARNQAVLLGFMLNQVVQLDSSKKKKDRDFSLLTCFHRKKKRKIPKKHG